MTTVELGGRRAVVTGGSRGIGAAVTRALAAAGASVTVVYRADDASAARVCAEVQGAGGTAAAVRANLVRPEQVRAVFETVAAPLDILVHAAALGSFKRVLDLRANQWDLTMSACTRSLLLCAQRAAPLMEGRAGRIVSLSSLGSSRVVPAYGAVGPAKAALEALTRALAVELAPRGIRVNAVSAGYVPGTSVDLHPMADLLRESARTRTPAGRPATPEDVANVVLLLCSPLADWIVGQTIVADGGYSLVL